jgi:hypothetical protein
MKLQIENEMKGSLYLRGRIWWMTYVVAGRQVCASTFLTNKRLAKKALALRVAEIIEGRYRLLGSSLWPGILGLYCSRTDKTHQMREE